MYKLLRDSKEVKMIRSECKDGKMECSLTGKGNDILNEFRVILEALSQQYELMLPTIFIIEEFLNDQIKEQKNT